MERLDAAPTPDPTPEREQCDGMGLAGARASPGEASLEEVPTALASGGERPAGKEQAGSNRDTRSLSFRVSTCFHLVFWSLKARSEAIAQQEAEVAPRLAA